MNFVLARTNCSDRKTIWLAGGPGNPFREIMIARRCADPDAELPKCYQLVVNVRSHRCIVRFVVHRGQIHSGDSVSLMIFDNPLQGRGHSVSVRDVAVTAFQRSDHSHLVVVCHSTFPPVIHGRGNTNRRSVISTTFVFWVIVTIDTVVGDKHLRLVAVRPGPLRHRQFAPVINQCQCLPLPKRQLVLVGAPRLDDSGLFKSNRLSRIVRAKYVAVRVRQKQERHNYRSAHEQLTALHGRCFQVKRSTIVRAAGNSQVEETRWVEVL